ncbi:uncharacterized protein [Nicotiana tomentosiformis]|uniref:uncharacterized protein n=1 Tax=Nicotiana tomentosiformis TaxID=4098 RepID=UPI00388C4BC6
MQWLMGFRTTWFSAKISCDELWVKDRGVLAKISVNLKAIQKELEGIIQLGSKLDHHSSRNDRTRLIDRLLMFKFFYVTRKNYRSISHEMIVYEGCFFLILFTSYFPLCISHSTYAFHFTPFPGYGFKLKNILCGAYNHPFAASDVLPRRAIVSVATSARKDNFKRSLEEFIQSQTIDDQGRPIQPSQEEIMDMWIKAVDGVHKGRVYGLGSEFSLGSRTSGLSVSYSFPHCSVDLDEFEQLNRKVEKITELYLQ